MSSLSLSFVNSLLAAIARRKVRKTVPVLLVAAPTRTFDPDFSGKASIVDDAVPHFPNRPKALTELLFLRPLLNKQRPADRPNRATP
jgi:hypothetical protein